MTALLVMVRQRSVISSCCPPSLTDMALSHASSLCFRTTRIHAHACTFTWSSSSSSSSLDVLNRGSFLFLCSFLWDQRESLDQSRAGLCDHYRSQMGAADRHIISYSWPHCVCLEARLYWRKLFPILLRLGATLCVQVLSGQVLL